MFAGALLTQTHTAGSLSRTSILSHWGHIRDIFGHIRDIFGHIRDIFGHIRDIFGHIGDILRTNVRPVLGQGFRLHGIRIRIGKMPAS